MIACSIIQKSQLEGAHRLDAEYYQPEYLDAMKKLSKASTIGALTSDVRYGLYLEPDYLERGVDFIRAMNLFDYDIDGEILKIDGAKVPPEYKLEAGDCLITRSGANTGATSVVYPKLRGATFGSYTIRVRFNKVNPFFAGLFLNTKYGIFQTLRLQTGMAQPNLNIPNIKEIKIPIFSENEQKKIEQICLEIHNQKEDAGKFYHQAEQLLLQELGLENFETENEPYTVVNFSDVKSAERMDAEFYQPLYNNLIKKIREKAVKMLEDCIKDYSTGFPFKSENYQENGIPLIRINNIGKGVLDLSDTAYITEKDASLSKKDLARPGDIVLSMSGSIGLTSLIPPDIQKCSINQRILHFKPKDIDPDYLVLLLNSIIGKDQLARIGTGGVQTNISYKDIKNLLIPILPAATQKKITDLVRASHAARKKAKELLAEAKRKVEEMMEKGKS
ncbi:MAG: restriction endonuclease subunit S [Candidatus Magasanikbacteria bacterium]|nr:restriction endonuclease subunit S [Candidatus Magasanikbacteria bacterium]